MYFVYVLYSECSDCYCLGHTDDPDRRLIEHNELSKDTYASKHRPWILKATVEIGPDRGAAMKVERYLKRLKSRKSIERLILKQNDKGFISYLIEKSSAG